MGYFKSKIYNIFSDFSVLKAQFQITVLRLEL